MSLILGSIFGHANKSLTNSIFDFSTAIENAVLWINNNIKFHLKWA